MHKFSVGCLILALLSMPAACSKDSPKTVETKPVDESVFSDYTPDGYPSTYKKYGADGVAKIRRVERAAAERITKAGRCDEIQMISLADSRSSPAQIVVFADCANGERFYVSERELGSSVTAAPVSELAISRKDGVSICLKKIPGLLKHPSSFDPAIFSGTSFSTFPGNGNSAVDIDFGAMNDFGAIVKHRGRCVFPAGSVEPEVTISVI
ncbi:hypothetical protein [Stenotrophomonas maltophilia]|uniref:hypothetical protein n=1 Tax=Stenotrophomonas maltophilia TaxID=40324 RepID=UPI0013DAE790|nr:hypothetical protein [Stenotrophomonas maltophilia]